MYSKKMIILLLLALFSMLTLSSCKKTWPRAGRWENADASLIISFDTLPYEALITIDGKQTKYFYGNEHNTDDIELYVTFDETPVLDGKILSYSDQEWVVSIEGREYYLHCVQASSETVSMIDSGPK